MMKKLNLCMGLAILLSLTACDRGPKSSYGFTLPDGDISVGQENFAKFKCNDCHNIEGLDTLRAGVVPVMTVTLGGMTPRIDTYGELVTSIINPSHKISQRYIIEPGYENGQMEMRNYNEVMTVQELIDVVAFLQSQYELVPFPKTHYMAY